MQSSHHEEINRGSAARYRRGVGVQVTQRPGVTELGGGGARPQTPDGPGLKPTTCQPAGLPSQVP